MDNINNVLQQYAATAANPKYKGDWNVINSKFPELKGFDTKVLQQYAATAANPTYKGDWNVINSKFPELFPKNMNGKGVLAPTVNTNLPGMTVPVQQKSTQQIVKEHPSWGQNNNNAPDEEWTNTVDPTLGQQVVQGAKDFGHAAYTGVNQLGNNIWNAVNEGAIKVAQLEGKLSDNPTWQDHVQNVIKGSRENQKSMSDWSQTHQPADNIAGTLGGVVPYLAKGVMDITMPETALFTTGALGVLGIGEGMAAYDARKQAEGVNPNNYSAIDELKKAALGLTYGLAYSAPLGKYGKAMSKVVPESVRKGIADRFLGSPEGQQVMNGIYEKLVSQVPSNGKILAHNLVKSVVGGTGAMAAMQGIKDLGDVTMTNKKYSLADIQDQLASSVEQGLIFSALAPLSAHANIANRKQRWNAQKEATFTFGNDGKPIEVVFDRKGNPQGYDLFGKAVKLSPEQQANTISVPSDVLSSGIEQYKKSGTLPTDYDRQVYSGRLTNALKNISDANGNVAIPSDEGTGVMAIVGKGQDGNYQGIDHSGQPVQVDANTPLKQVHVSDVYNALMSKYDEVNGRKKTGSEQPLLNNEPTPAPEVTPEQQAVNDIHNSSNPDMNAIVHANIAGTDAPVRIVKGNIATKEDGTIDRGASDEAVYYQDADGKTKIAPIDNVTELASNVPVDAAIGQIQQKMAAANLASQLQVGDTGAMPDGTTSTIEQINPDGTFQLEVEMPDGSVRRAIAQSEEMAGLGFTTQTSNESIPTPVAESSSPKSPEGDLQAATSPQPLSQGEGQTEMPTPQSPEGDLKSVASPASIPTDEKGKRLFEQAPVEATIGAFKEAYDTPEKLSGAVDAVINRLSTQMKKAGKPKLTGDPDVDMQNELAAKQQIKDIQTKLDYWKSVNDALSAEAMQGADSHEAVWQNTADNSTDPNEIANAYNQAKEAGGFDAVEPWQQQLVGMKVHPESWNRFGDRNKAGDIKAWLSPKKEALTPDNSIDTIAQALSDTYGVEVTPQAIVDFIDNNPKNKIEPSNVYMRDLDKRFSEVATSISGHKVGGVESPSGKLFLSMFGKQTAPKSPEGDLESATSPQPLSQGDWQSAEEILNDPFADMADRVKAANELIAKYEENFPHAVKTTVCATSEEFVQQFGKQANFVSEELKQKKITGAYNEGNVFIHLPDVLDTPELEKTWKHEQQHAVNAEKDLTPLYDALGDGEMSKTIPGYRNMSINEIVDEHIAYSAETYNPDKSRGLVDDLIKENLNILTNGTTDGIDQYPDAGRGGEQRGLVAVGSDTGTEERNNAPDQRGGDDAGRSDGQGGAEKSQEQGVKSQEATSNPSQEGKQTSTPKSPEGDLESEPTAQFKASDIKEGEGIPQYVDRVVQEKQIHDELQRVNTEPTEAQKEAGNYQKGHITVQGMDISIENPVGSVRRGVDEDGKAWENTMQTSYGYFKRTEGKDGDHIDVFVGPDVSSEKVFVVDQNNPTTGAFDESKVMLGFDTPQVAKEAYLSNYEPDWKGFGAITEVSVEDFKKWLYDGAKQRKPFSEYVDTPEAVRLRTDRSGNEIGDGGWNVEPEIMDFKEYPQITSNVNKSQTTESTYVTYTNKDNSKSITVRFSNHENNAVKFGDQLNGYTATANQILYKLGLKTRDFIPEKYLSIWATQVKRKDVGNYEMADKTMPELYALGKDADLSDYKGKVAKNSNWLILGDKVSELDKTTRDAFGNSVRLGKYEYHDITPEEYAKQNSESKIRFRREEQSEIIQNAKQYADVEDFISAYKDADFRDAHSSPGFDDTPSEQKIEDGGDFSLVEVANGFHNQPDDYFAPRIGARYYGYDDKEGMQSYYAIKKAIDEIKSGKKNVKITAYRAIPKEVEQKKLIDRDWITFSREYAVSHGEYRFGEKQYRIIKQNVPVEHVWWDGNDINEWGYDTGQTTTFGRSDLKTIWEQAQAPKFRIIGERGAARMEDAENIIDNLKVAKEMEAAGKQPKEIRLATGWEKGMDGLWRYEVPDAEIDVDVLNELKNNSELANKNVNIDLVTYRKQENGLYTLSLKKKGATNTNEFADYKNLSVNELIGIIDNKEVSDKILNGEGNESFMGKNWDEAKEIKTNFTTFITGGELLPRVIQDKALFEVYPELKDVVVVFDKAQGLNASYETGDNQIIIRIGAVWKQTKSTLIHEIQHAIQDIEGFAKGGSAEAMNDYSLKESKKIIEDKYSHLPSYKTAKENGTLDEWVKKMVNATGEGITPLEAYRRLAGEVEARNASARMQMTPEERRNTLLSETADVAPEDQIVLMDQIDRANSEIDAKDYEAKLKEIKDKAIADGTFMKAPNGKDTNLNERQWLQVRTPEFKKWFGDWENDPENASKVVDKNGEPMVVYHGTGDKFFKFDKSKLGSREDAFFFTSNEKMAKDYGKPMSVFLSSKRFIDLDEDYRDVNGVQYHPGNKDFTKYFDGYSTDKDTDYNEYAVYNPNQIKSATANTGAFDEGNADIRFRTAGERLNKQDRISAIVDSKPLEITGEEYKGNYELNRNSAKSFIKDNLRGEYVNSESGDVIQIRKDGAQKITSHSMTNEDYLKTISVLPELIKNAVYIDELPNLKDKPKYTGYRYYVSGLKIGEKDYTVKLTVGVDASGYKLYDCSLTNIEKGKLIKEVGALTTTLPSNESTLSGVKDTKLIHLLQESDAKSENSDSGNGNEVNKIPVKPEYTPEKSLEQFVNEVVDYNKSQEPRAKSQEIEDIRFRSMPTPPVFAANTPAGDVAQQVTAFAQETKEIFKDADAQMQKIHRLHTMFLDRARPLEEYQRLMVEKGASLSDANNAYYDFIATTSWSTNQVAKFTESKIEPLQERLATLVKSKKLDTLPMYNWNMAKDDTGKVIANGKISNYDRISLYIQAKDILEQIEQNGMGRGEEGFANDVKRHDVKDVNPELKITLQDGTVLSKEEFEKKEGIISITKDTVKYRPANSNTIESLPTREYIRRQKIEPDPKSVAAIDEESVLRLADGKELTSHEYIQQYVNEFENAVGADEVAKIWSDVNAVNKYSLDMQLKYGLISQSTYDSYNIPVSREEYLNDKNLIGNIKTNLLEKGNKTINVNDEVRDFIDMNKRLDWAKRRLTELKTNSIPEADLKKEIENFLSKQKATTNKTEKYDPEKKSYYIENIIKIRNSEIQHLEKQIIEKENEFPQKIRLSNRTSEVSLNDYLKEIAGYQSEIGRKYYVPQRGWRSRDMDTEEHYYERLSRSEDYKNPYNAALVKAKGRRTLAGDPLAYMQSIGESTISSIAKNKTKQKFLEFALENSDFARTHDFFAIKKAYYVATGNLDENGYMTYERTYTRPDKSLFDADKKTSEELAALMMEKRDVAISHQNKELSNSEFIKKLTDISDREKALKNSIHVKHEGYESTTLQQRTSEEKKQHTVVALKNGIEYEIQFSKNYTGERVANILNRAFSSNEVGRMGRGWRKATGYMSSMMTQYNPGFAAANAVRDMQLALVSNGVEFGMQYNMQFLANYAKCQRAVWQYVVNDQFDGDNRYSPGKYGKYMEEFFEDGAATGWSFLKDVEQLRKDMKLAIDPTIKQTIIKGKYGVVNFGGIRQMFGLLGEGSELSTRFAEYVTSREMKNPDGSNKYTREQATQHAKDVTVNFDRKGTSRTISLFFSFFNASVQGTNKLLRMMRDRRVAQKLAGVFATYAAYGFLMGLMDDDDEKDRRGFTDWEKMINLTFGNFKIPLPQGFLRGFYGSFFQLGKAVSGKSPWNESLLTASQFFAGEVVPEQIIFWSNGLMYDDKTGTVILNPLSEKTWKRTFRGVAPTALQPVVDMAMNTNFMGGNIYRTEFTNKQMDTQAERVMGKKNTSPLAQDISNWLWDLGGGDTSPNNKSLMRKDMNGTVNSAFNINPAVIEFLVRGYFAGTGKFVLDTYQTIYQMVTPGQHLDVSNVAVANVFYKQYKEQDDFKKNYYDLQNKLDYQLSQWSGLSPEMKLKQRESYQKAVDSNWKDPDNAAMIYKWRTETSALMKNIGTTQKYLSKIDEEEASGKLTPEQAEAAKVQRGFDYGAAVKLLSNRLSEWQKFNK
jgi:hypothetical protein